MQNTTRLTAEKRKVSGSSASGRLRREGLLPCVVNDSEGKSVLIQINRHDFEQMLHHHASDNLILDMEIDGEKARKTLLKEVQRHPVHGHVLHADFVEISMTRKMRVDISIKLVGEPVGVSQNGGVLDHVLREVEVECLPGDLVEAIEVDVSALQIGDTVLVRDIQVPPSMTVLADGDLAVAGVLAPSKEEEVVVQTAEPAEGEEPELVGKKKEEEEGSQAEEEQSAEKKEKKEKKEK